MTTLTSLQRLARKKWIKGNGEGAKVNELIECEIKHCNPKLKEPNQIIRGCFKDDGFYFEDGAELSWNWNIVKWRKINATKTI